MKKAMGLLLMLFGVLLFFKTLWFVLLLMAFALAIGALTGWVGRWGYSMATILLLLTVPVLLFKTMVIGLAFVFKLLPVLLIIVGAYTLLKRVE